MNRAILTPATLPPSALAELKQWLGITLDRDDALLTALLNAALDTCEAFIGALPLEVDAEEVLNVGNGWQTLSTRPVSAILGLDLLSAQGQRTAIPAMAWEADLAADGTGRVRLPGGHINASAGTTGASRAVVFFTAGLAPDWDALPAALRHGIIRLAAHQHRERENSGAAALPPASVAALWQPWRQMRLV